MISNVEFYVQPQCLQIHLSMCALGCNVKCISNCVGVKCKLIGQPNIGVWEFLRNGKNILLKNALSIKYFYIICSMIFSNCNPRILSILHL